MSAMAAAIDGDTIHLFADAVFYDEDGTVAGIHPKIWQVPGLNAAFISRGQGRAFPYFQELVKLGDAKTWDELKESLPLIWQLLDRWMDKTPMDILIAGFSEGNNRPEILYRHTIQEDDQFKAGATYIYLDGVCSFGCVMEKADDVCAEAIRAFEVARHDKGNINGFYDDRKECFAHAIGGRLQHIELTRNGERGETLRVWPDRVGEKIQPLAA